MRASDSEARRGFLKALTAAFGAAMAAIAVIPGLGFLGHPLRRGAAVGAGGGAAGAAGAGGGSSDEAVPLGSASTVVPGKPVRASVVGDRTDAWVRLRRVKLGSVWLVRAREGGEVKAFSTICPHLGCGVDWNEKSGTFQCPCHDSAFDAEGRCLGGPSPRGLDQLDVVAAGDELKVRYRRFKLGTSGKEPIG